VNRRDGKPLYLLAHGRDAVLSPLPGKPPVKWTQVTGLQRVLVEDRPLVLVMGNHPGAELAGPLSVLAVATDVRGTVESQVEAGPVVRASLTPAGRLALERP
jgi:hypothetical protein